MKYKTFNEFWSEFLQVTFHLGNPERWDARERRADWVKQNLNLQKGQLLNLGCGDGILDIWLSRKGFDVTSVDRAESVLELAKKEDDTRKVKFIAQDIRKQELAPASFDAILFLETAGLLGQNDDSQLFQKCYGWLKPGGKMLLDSPEVVQDANSWTKEFNVGKVSCESSFDKNSRIQRIEHVFEDRAGNVFGLFDPIRDQLPGISRYIYPKGELRELLIKAGFKVFEVNKHYYDKNYYALVGMKTS
jgi:cyclopropane fatty-acyl-phospholipid synthase-like methyltransferase